MSDEIKNRLICAARQFRHNSDNSPDICNPKEGFVIAYDKNEIDDLVSGLQSEVERLRGRCGELEEFLAKSKTALRKHRWCGDCYPENGWPEVNEALAYAQRLRQQAAESAGGEDGQNINQD